MAFRDPLCGLNRRDVNVSGTVRKVRMDVMVATPRLLLAEPDVATIHTLSLNELSTRALSRRVEHVRDDPRIPLCVKLEGAVLRTGTTAELAIARIEHRQADRPGPARVQWRYRQRIRSHHDGR